MVLNNKIKLVVFDLDGTLVDSKYDLTDAVNFTRKQYDFNPLSVDKVASYLGSGIVALVKSVLPELDDGQLKVAVKTFMNFYGEHLLDKTKFYKDIDTVLAELNSFKKIVLSNKTELFSKKIIEYLNLKQYFVQVYGGDSFKEKKPNPLPIYEIMKNFSLNKENVVMVGDGANDILVGKNAGIKTIGVLYGYSSQEQLNELAPDYQAKTSHDIAKILLSNFNF